MDEIDITEVTDPWVRRVIARIWRAAFETDTGKGSRLMTDEPYGNMMNLLWPGLKQRFGNALEDKQLKPDISINYDETAMIVKCGDEIVYNASMAAIRMIWDKDEPQRLRDMMDEAAECCTIGA